MCDWSSWCGHLVGQGSQWHPLLSFVHRPNRERELAAGPGGAEHRPRRSRFRPSRSCSLPPAHPPTDTRRVMKGHPAYLSPQSTKSFSLRSRGFLTKQFLVVEARTTSLMMSNCYIDWEYAVRYGAAVEALSQGQWLFTVYVVGFWLFTFSTNHYIYCITLWCMTRCPCQTTFP